MNKWHGLLKANLYGKAIGAEYSTSKLFLFQGEVGLCILGKLSSGPKLQICLA